MGDVRPEPCGGPLSRILTFEYLPDDVLGGIVVLSVQSHPRSLLSILLACRRLQGLVDRRGLLQTVAKRRLELLLPVLFLSQAGGDVRFEFCDVDIFRIFMAALSAKPSSVSLLADVLGASSTDNSREAADHVLYPRAVYRNGATSYWSSAGNTSATSNDSITFRLAHNFCILHRLEIRPFQAKWQQGRPVYAPRGVQVSLNSKQGQAVWTSPTYAVDPSHRLQSFELPLVACPVDAVTVTFIGRQQKQQEDGLYYTCIRYVRLLGVPVSKFNLSGDGKLSFLPGDPLQTRGGLSAVSEKGRRAVSCRLEQLFQVTLGFNPPWWSDSDLESDSDGG